MRTLSTAAAVSAISVAVALPVAAGAAPATTNAPQIVSVKVTITDRGITMKPAAAARGSSAQFILTNRGTKPHTIVLGDIKRGIGKKIGFTSTLAPNEQKTIVMYLDYRGPLPYFASRQAYTKNKPLGSFKIF